MASEVFDPPGLTDAAERARIRTALDDTLVVEAAAGTGKTTELVARIVELLASGKAAVDQIVAVTFTEKAAGELKLRLRTELEHARVAGDRPDGRVPLEDALARLEEAHVGTIHGFCAELLRERPVEARVDPEFSVLTDGQSERIFDEAFRVWLQEQLQSPGEGVRRSLRRPEPPWRGEEDANGPVARLRAAGLTLREWRDFGARWRREPFDREAEVRRVAGVVRQFAALTAQASWAGDSLSKGTAGLRRLVASLDQSGEAGEDDVDGWEAALVALCSDRDLAEAKRRPGTKPSFAPGVSRAQAVAALDALLSEIAAFRRTADADLAARLQEELQGCLARYDELKRRAGALDFLDLLLQARDLVRGHGDVRRAFQRRFRFIFVDEFQDTDPLQAEILLLLAADEPDRRNAPATEPPADWRRLPIRRGGLFIVGDPKQSIYRFRRADVGVYQEVCDRLVTAEGAVRVTLRTSFRSVPGIQRLVNAAFSPVMTGDRRVLQADYVPLAHFRSEHPVSQPPVVALPVPYPYGRWKVTASAIEQSLPGAIGAFVSWLLDESGWQVDDGNGTLVPIRAGHVCILFRRFISYGEDITRSYVESLEARGVPHLLIGGRSFHEREEVEALRAALAAIEWPDDQLAVYATLRGSLFALGEEALLEYWHRHPRHRFHPFDVPHDLPPSTHAAGEALALLRELHIRRNHRPVADTITDLLGATRAHVTFALRPAGEQALANVMQVAELARQHEADGGISFRGFVDELRVAAERLDSPEAPVLEEGSEGVRLMTVHKAKGLEFPVVVLADITAKLNRPTAGRALDPDAGLCAVRLAGCAPHELLERQDEEIARDEAEGVRLAYVAATRARDLLVVPVVGDQTIDGWVRPLNAAVYPAVERRQQPEPAPGCPPFRKDTVLARANDEVAHEGTVAAGLHRFDGPDAGAYPVVWWDPAVLRLDVEPPGGLRRAEIIARDGSEPLDAEALASYHEWRNSRGSAIAAASVPSLRVRTVTEWAQSGDAWPLEDLIPEVDVVEASRTGERPGGARFGVLVHALLATAPLDADAETIRAMAAVEGRIAGAPRHEVQAAIDLVRSVLGHPLLERARSAWRRGQCRREVPVTLDAGPVFMEGVVDLAFEEGGRWIVVDFKTDDRPAATLEVYTRQVAMYAAAFARATTRPVEALILAL